MSELFLPILLHSAISLVAIGAGFVVMTGLLKSQRREGWTNIFLWMTIMTSITGFILPFTLDALKPPHIFGFLSLAVLALAALGRYHYNMAGMWRSVYVVTAVIAQYLNFFVLVVQIFQKVPFANALAPTQKEPPFAIAQGLALVVFVVWGWQAVKKFHPPA